MPNMGHPTHIWVARLVHILMVLPRRASRTDAQYDVAAAGLQLDGGKLK